MHFLFGLVGILECQSYYNTSYDANENRLYDIFIQVSKSQLIGLV